MNAPALISESRVATEAIGAALGAALAAGDVIAIDGDLGAGKTILARGLAEGCGVDVALVRSPTFVFHHVYPGRRLTLHHIDCYRLGRGADLGFLDLDTLVEDGAVAIEWAGHADLSAYRPVHVTIGILDGDRRTIVIGDDAPPRFAAVIAALIDAGSATMADPAADPAAGTRDRDGGGGPARGSGRER